MSDPRTAPYAAVKLAEVDRLADVDPGNQDITDGSFHLVRRHFDVQAFGVNGVTGNAGDVMVIEHHERDDPENRTNGHEELFAVMSGHARVHDRRRAGRRACRDARLRPRPALLRSAHAAADGTAILAVGGRPGVPFGISTWEQAIP